MKILVVGSGGREHALCWSIAASPLCSALYCAPGNAGIAEEATCVPIKADDLDGLLAFVAEKAIDFVVIGPEVPLVMGLADRLAAAGVRCFGPSAAAARLEGSKKFMKDICAGYGIPTAAYSSFDDADKAKTYIRAQEAPIVVKADGLAAGKGVTVAQSVEEAIEAVEAAMLDGAFGKAGATVVVEEFMVGEEVSVFALADGEEVLILASAQDHKAVLDCDLGPNTGGMGAYSPAPVMTEALAREVEEKILRPTIRAMKAEGAPFSGVLYAGIMVTESGPRLLEFNVRFGDPECQVLVMRSMSDLLPALIATADGALKDFHIRWLDKAALTVVMASHGYPGPYAKGTVIRGIEAIRDEDVKIFHAGTERDAEGRLIATGGRVLNVTALGDSVADAQARAYAAVDKIYWPQGFCRRDIGWRAVQREKG